MVVALLDLLLRATPSILRPLPARYMPSHGSSQQTTAHHGNSSSKTGCKPPMSHPSSSLASPLLFYTTSIPGMGQNMSCSQLASSSYAPSTAHQCLPMNRLGCSHLFQDDLRLDATPCLGGGVNCRATSVVQPLTGSGWEAV